MSRILGCDPSISSLGLCLYDTKTKKIVATKLLQPKPNPDFKHLIYIVDQVAKFTRKYKPDFVAIEDPIFFKGRISGVKRTHYLHGLLRYYFSQTNLPIYEFSPPDLKKRYTGKGNANKGQMVWNALDHGIKFYSNDLADAYALCWILAKSLGESI